MSRDVPEPDPDLTDTGPIRRISGEDGVPGRRPPRARPRQQPAGTRATPPRRGEAGVTRPRAERPERPARRQTPTTRTEPDDEPTTEPPTVADDTEHSPRHAHGHGHGHEPPPPASRRLRILLAALLGPLAAAALVGVLVLYPWGEPSPASQHSVGTPVEGTVTAVATGPCLAPGQVEVGEPRPGSGQDNCLNVDIRLTDGAAEGSGITKAVPIEPSTPRFSPGDDVVLAYSGAEPQNPNSYQVQDFQRGTPLLLLAGLFAVAVIVLGRWRGLAALGALALSFAVLALFVLPAILAGESPLLVAIAGSGVIMFAALYLTHGLSARTSVAVLGTLVSLALIGVLSAIFSAAARLTGLDESTSTLIGSLGHGIDARGLLLAGVVIGALGVLDDVTVTQTSAVWELRAANPSLGRRALYTAGLRIGRDHVGSAVNTLVMAYAGAALPVLLLATLSGVDLGSILGSQDLAEEIVRTLAGSIGIVAAVPVTTLLAALIAGREELPTTSGHTNHS